MKGCDQHCRRTAPKEKRQRTAALQDAAARDAVLNSAQASWSAAVLCRFAHCAQQRPILLIAPESHLRVRLRADSIVHRRCVRGLFEGLTKLPFMQQFGNFGEGMEMFLELPLR